MKHNIRVIVSFEWYYTPLLFAKTLSRSLSVVSARGSTARDANFSHDADHIFCFDSVLISLLVIIVIHMNGWDFVDWYVWHCVRLYGYLAGTERFFEQYPSNKESRREPGPSRWRECCLVLGATAVRSRCGEGCRERAGSSERKVDGRLLARKDNGVKR